MSLMTTRSPMGEPAEEELAEKHSDRQSAKCMGGAGDKGESDKEEDDVMVISSDSGEEASAGGQPDGPSDDPHR